MSDIKELEASIIKALRGKGYRATLQRIAIGRFALRNHDHPTAQIIYREVKKVYPTVSLATVYKTIQILEEVGLIQELSLPKDQTRFDSDMEPHINLICLGCGNISDFEDPALPEIMAKVSAAEKFAVTGQRFDIYGLCQSCKPKKKAGQIISS
ncbi:Ferric uptake regulator family protein [uncultured archaeon]|nr:Ferric uptake regulator family protein [uncultured archaeon]